MSLHPRRPLLEVGGVGDPHRLPERGQQESLAPPALGQHLAPRPQQPFGIHPEGHTHSSQSRASEGGGAPNGTE